MINSEKILDLLVDSISKIERVQAIGISGSKTPLPLAGEGDIDLFIYCDEIPTLESRQAIMEEMSEHLKDCKLEVFDSKYWGAGDFALINGVETWLMYFRVEDVVKNLEEILAGKFPGKLDNYYYPVGRCAMLKNITVLFDKKDFLKELKASLEDYPEKLAEVLIEYHIEDLEDLEDLERAVVREDVFFYHFALDLALDHFLQAIFAMNRTYFPSRKRTMNFIEGFKIKPERCSERLLEVLSLGGHPEGVKKSFEIWKSLLEDIKKLK